MRDLLWSVGVIVIGLVWLWVAALVTYLVLDAII